MNTQPITTYTVGIDSTKQYTIKSAYPLAYKLKNGELWGLFTISCGFSNHYAQWEQLSELSEAEIEQGRLIHDA